MPFDSRLLAGISALTAVIEAGSFARAAEALGLTPSGVSRAIARLEANVGVRLLNRTTRSVSLSDEGRRFFEQVRPSLDIIEEAAAGAAGSAQVVRGRLRVNMDPPVSQHLLAGRLGGFLARYPELTLELLTREPITDLVGAGIDVAVRFGEPPVSSLIARKLVETRVLTVAAPSYLKKHGRPKHPHDLLQHTCIHYRDPVTGQPYEWEFRQGRKVLPVEPPGRLIVSDTATMRQEVVAGTGIAQVLTLAVRDLLEEGRIIDLFPDWPGETFPLYALYPSRRHAPAKVKAFLDFLLETIR